MAIVAKALALLPMGVLAGSLLALLANRRLIGPPAVNSGSEIEALEVMARRLERLESDLRSLVVHAEPQVQVSALEEVPQRVPVPDMDAKGIAERLESLQTSVTALASRLDAIALAVQQSLLNGSRAASEPLPESLPETPPDVRRFNSLRGRELEELTQQHLLWTYEKVGAEYGRPTGVAPSPNGVGIKFYYEQPDGSTFVFWFIDGKVIKAFW